MDLDVQQLPHLEEERVAGRPQDDAVEPDAVVDDAVEVAVSRRLPHALQMLADDRRVAVEARQGEPHRGFLQRAAHEIDLVLGGGVIVVDEGAAPRADGDEAGLFEVAQRLADRRLA